MSAYDEVKDFSVHFQSQGHATDLQAGHGDKEYTWGSDKLQG